jgi:hypothetical protein
MKTLRASILGFAIGLFGCSGTGKEAGQVLAGVAGLPGASGGSGSLATGGMPFAGSQAATGGLTGASGAAFTGGTLGSGGTSANAASGGTIGTAGAATGGISAGGAPSAGASSGGNGASGGAVTGGTCTSSKSAGKSVSGTGPHKVVIETNGADGIKCGTIFRPEDLGGSEKYPLFVWGEGGCSQDGLSNQAAMGEIASWGYFIVADGTPGGSGACTGGQDGKALLDYITWAIAENGRSCSAYYQSLETTKIAADGFSCGGLMAENVSGDPRFSAIGITSSGQMSENAALYDKIHTPFKVMDGGSSDIAYANGLRDYQQISSRGVASVYFSKTSAGHGGDLTQARGDFNSVNLAWLNWQLKGDVGATGKGFLFGATCKLCTDSGFTYQSANIQ